MGLILGEQSGGGNSIYSHYILPDNTVVDISDTTGIINRTGEDFELGVKPDIKIENLNKYSDKELVKKVLELIKLNEISQITAKEKIVQSI